jgi:uncharacterized protein (TIGR03437 family)
VAAVVTVTAGKAFIVKVVSQSQNGSPVTLTCTSPFTATSGTTATATLTGTATANFTATITAVAGTARSTASFAVVDVPPALGVGAATGGTTTSPEGIASAYGEDLATTSVVVVKDASGVARSGVLLYVSTGQVNFVVPAGTAPGTATITVTSAAGTVSVGTVLVAPVAPGLFTLDGSLVAATVLRVHADSSRDDESVLTPVAAAGPGETVVLSLYGTGFRGGAPTATIGGVPATVLWSGPQGSPGLDQANVILPALGAGTAEIVLTAGGLSARATIVVK